MRNIKILCWFIFLPTLALAKGGGIVGNGAGLSEQNLFYAYLALADSIDHCLSAPSCDLNEAEKIQILKIRDVAIANEDKENLIRFKSAKEDPEFFELSVIESHRIARTGLTPDDPIWFNTDLLYTETGAPTLDFALATAILLHEVGHQAGNPDHAFLDHMAARVRFSLEQEQTLYRYDMVAQPLTVQVISYDGPTFRADLFFESGKTKRSLTSATQFALSRLSGGPGLIGFEIWNGHWESPCIISGVKVLPFLAWVRYSSVIDGKLLTSQATLKIEFTFSESGEAELKGVAVQELI